EEKRGPLLGWQLLQRGAHLLKCQPCLRTPARLIGADMDPLFLGFLSPNVPRAQLIDPDRLHDSKHPAVEARPLLKLVRPGKRPLARRLDEVVGLDSRAGQAAGEAPQAGQHADELVADRYTHGAAPGQGRVATDLTR